MIKIGNFFLSGVHSKVTDKQFIEMEIRRWESSPERIMQIKVFIL